MVRLLSRILAVMLAAAAVFEAAVPGAAYAAVSSEGEQSPMEDMDAGLSDDYAEPQETDGSDKGGGQTENSGGSGSSLPAQPLPPAEKEEEKVYTEEAAEEKTGGDTAPEGEKDAPGGETGKKTETVPETEKETESEKEPDAKAPDTEIHTGRAVFCLDGAGGLVKVVIQRTQEQPEEPDYILEKREDGDVYLTGRDGECHKASVSEEGYVLELEEPAGTRVLVTAEAAEGCRVGAFDVRPDSGQPLQTGFEEKRERFSFAVSVAGGECRIISVSFEADDSRDRSGTAAEAKNKVSKLLGAAAEPNWTKGGGGVRDVSGQVKIQHRNRRRYWYKRYGFLGSDKEDWSTFAYAMYMGNDLVGWSVCVDPLFDGRDLEGVYAGKVYQVSAPMFVKALYYGAGGPGEEVIRSITGTSDYVANNIVTHVAASEIYARLGYSQSEPGDGFIDASAKLKDLVFRFAAAIENLSVPAGYYGYVTEKNGISDAGYRRQNFAFGSFSLTNGRVRVRKISDCPAISQNNLCYSLKGARYWIYKSEETALARGDAGWVSGGSLNTDENGVSNTFELSPGTYYLIEGKAPGGFIRSDTVYPFTVSGGKTAEIVVSDPPAGIPASLTIDKKCRENEDNKKDNKTNSLEGTQFTVNYYDGFYDASTLPSEPYRSWVIEAAEEDGRYRAGLCEKCLVSGQLFVMDDIPVLPLGTITIRETKAAPGYLCDGKFGGTDTYIGQIRFNADKESSPLELIDVLGERSSENTFAVHDTPLPPSIVTSASDEASGTKSACAGKEVTIRDTVTFKNLIVGKEYILRGKLVDKDSGETVRDAGGKEVTGEMTFTPQTIDGTVTLPLTFEADISLAGKTTVVFETLLSDGREAASHADLSDESQTIRFPRVRTAAVCPLTGDHIMPAGKNAQIVDTVSYENLTPGTQYRIRGWLCDRASGKVLTVSGKEVVIEKTFTPDKESGQTEVSFSFDASGLEGRSLVVFEELYIGETLIAMHKDPDDPGQTVSVPGVLTNACDRDTAEKNTLAAKDRVILDSISYSGLVAGRTYEITGQVRIRTGDTEDFETAVIVPSRIVSAEGDGRVTFDPEKVTFIPKGTKDEPVSGVLTVGFLVDASELMGEQLVVGETVRFKGRDIAVHRDIRDADQTVLIPHGETVSVDTSTGIKNTLAADNRVFKDTFRYENLIPGKTYRFTGKVMVKSAGTEEGREVLEETPSVMTDEKGRPVENGFVEFVPGQRDGTLDLYFSIDASKLENREVTVFEKVTLGGSPVILHEVLDGTQTLYVPEGRTAVIDSETGDRVAFPDKEVTLIDTMVYRNLIPGTKYSVRGRIMRRAAAEEIPSALTGACFVDPAGGNKETKGAEIEVSGNMVTFIPDSRDGALALTFVFDASQLQGEDAVVFERVYYEEREVIVHENIDDPDQTVHFPSGRTSAEDAAAGGHIVKAAGRVVIRDRVRYENLIPGKEYVLRGKLMLKPSGKENSGKENSGKEGLRELDAKMVDQNGNEIKEKVFTPKQASGFEDVLFLVSADKLAGRSAVAFERMEFVNPKTLTRAAVFCHEDPEDGEQTVTFEGPGADKSRTGDDNDPLFWLLILAAAAAGAVILRKGAPGRIRD